MTSLILEARRAVGFFVVAMVGLTGCGTDAGDDDDTGGTEVEVIAATTGGGFAHPRDAVPDPDGGTIFFVAGGDGGEGVFSVPGTGGSAEPVFQGAPFVHPRGISVSSDGTRVYVADTDAEAVGGTGQIFSVSLTERQPMPLAGSEGTRPTALEVVSEDGADQIYFAGIDPADGAAGVFKLPATGGTLTVVVKGDGLISPDGVAVHGDQVFIADQDGGSDGRGRVLRFTGGVLSTVLDGVLTGDPAGIALTLDGSTLLVSAIDPELATDQVVLLDTATLSTGIFTDVIGANHDGGGVHRAHNRDVFAWADLTAGTTGTVYKITFK